jgi:hypothetical protein
VVSSPRRNLAIVALTEASVEDAEARFEDATTEQMAIMGRIAARIRELYE